MQATTFASPAELAASVLRGTSISDPHVERVEGRLILRGIAGNYKTKQLAGERAAAAAPGMTIVNGLRVAQPRSGDRHLGRRVAAAIEKAVPGCGKRVHVRAHGGIVEIEGAPYSADERCRIEGAAWQTNGVLRVDCRLTPAENDERDADVTGALEAYVRRAANMPPGAVRVRYRAGIVTITGTVGSEVQAQAIEDLVRWHERVVDVLNHLRIAAPA